MAEIAASTRPAPLRIPAVGASSVVFLTIFGFLACLGEQLLNDPDTQWHVAVGSQILSERAVPWVETYSHTFAGHRWIAKEWLSQILLAGAHRIAGYPGVALLAACAAAGGFALLHAILRRHVIASVALAATLLAVLFCASHLLARPHVLALPLVVLWVAGLVEACERRSGPPWWLLVVMAAWANLHAGFTIGFAIAGLMAVEALAAAPPLERRRAALGWTAFLILIPLAACLTPYGPRSMLVTATLFGSGEPLPYITEWQPLAFDALGIGAACLMVALPLALAWDGRRNAMRIVCLVLLAIMTLRHARFLELFVLAAPILAAAPLARLRPNLAAPSAREEGSAMASATFAGLGACAIGGAMLWFAPSAEPPASMRPVAALEAARRAGLLAGRVYNAYDFGGYLISEGVETFIDGRSDQIFLGGFTRGLEEDLAAPTHRPFLERLKAYGVGWAIVRAGSPEARKLAEAGWSRLHADPVAEIHVRPGESAR